MGQDEPPSVCSQSSKASRRMSCLQSASPDSRCGILGRKAQTLHRLDHNAAYKGWGQSGLSCKKMACPYCLRFSSLSLLPHTFYLIPFHGRGVLQANNEQPGEWYVLREPIQSHSHLRNIIRGELVAISLTFTAPGTF